MDDLTAALARIEVLEAEQAQMRAWIEGWEEASQVFRKASAAPSGPPRLTLVRPA
jgi:hypothetical protein